MQSTRGVGNGAASHAEGLWLSETKGKPHPYWPELSALTLESLALAGGVEKWPEPMLGVKRPGLWPWLCTTSCHLSWPQFPHYKMGMNNKNSSYYH